MLDRLTEGWRPWAVIGALLLACALPGLIALQPLDRDESRFVQATTQMFESGDFVRISFQDEPRNKKPVGIHWFQAAAVSLSGAPEGRVVQWFRLPSLLGAWMCAMAVFGIGARLFDRRSGLLAGAALACSLVLSTEAGIAKTDAALAGFTALSFLGLAGLRGTGAPARWAPWLFWTGFAFAGLIKGPVGPLVMVLSMVALSAWERDTRWLRPLWHWPSLALAALVLVPWHVAIWIATDGQFFFDAIGQDLAPKMAGRAENPSIPPGAHLLIAPVILWPASILIPAAAWLGWKGRADPAVRFALCWLVPGWLMFEAAPAKLAHYTLPVHGALVLLGAAAVLGGAWRAAWVRWSGVAIAALGGLVLAALPFALGDEALAGARVAPWLPAAIIATSALIALTLAARGRTAAVGALALSAVAVAVTLKGVFVPALPALDVSARTSAQLVRLGVHPRLSPGAPGPLVGAGYQEPSLIVLTRSDSALSSVSAAAAAARPGAGVVVEAAREAALREALAARGLRIVLDPAATVTGLNYSKGDKVTLLIGKVAP